MLARSAEEIRRAVVEAMSAHMASRSSLPASPAHPTAASSATQVSSLASPSPPMVAPGKSTSMERRRQSAEDFVFGRLIGEGSFSSVFLTREVSTGREFAVKVCDKLHILKEKKQAYVQSEKMILVKIAAEWDEKVPFFVKIHSTFQVRTILLDVHPLAMYYQCYLSYAYDADHVMLH